MGWQASILWNADRSASAFEMYLQLGDMVSLSQLCREISHHHDVSEGWPDLQEYLRNLKARQVITLYLLSLHDSMPTKFAEKWFRELLKVSENFNDEAEFIALFSYKLGFYDLCELWLEHTEESVLSRRLWIKMHLLNGEVDKAVAELAQLIRMLPPEAKKQPLQQSETGYENDKKKDIGKLLLGDLGSLYLSSGLYTKALDALYKGGHWVDAAYVAEQVLSVDELQEYVNTIDNNGEKYPIPPCQKNGARESVR
jgi:hypothetical protein